MPSSVWRPARGERLAVKVARSAQSLTLTVSCSEPASRHTEDGKRINRREHAPVCSLAVTRKLNTLLYAYSKYNLSIPSIDPLSTMKTILLAVCLAAATANAYCDAIKYRQANGQVLISNQGAGEGAREISVHRDEYVSPYNQQRAADDLQRQKEFLNARERENRVSVVSSGQAGNATTNNDIPQLHSCLRKVTGTFGLSPSQEASRKVSCYNGTVGLNDDCQRSVAATMRLSTQEEMRYKSYCPR